MSHSYSIRPTVDGEVFRWVIWSEDEVTPIANGAAASEEAALAALRTRAAAMARGEAPQGTAAPPH